MLQQLGINETFFIQFGFFIFIITFLSLYVFGPYAKAVDERERQTKGSQGEAAGLDQQASDLYSKYEMRAREIQGQIQEVYRQARSEAQQDYEQTVQQARAQSEGQIERVRAQIRASVASAQESLRVETPQIVMALTNKLLGK
jgi:F-type H+-transporting ATPase subunit b